MEPNKDFTTPEKKNKDDQEDKSTVQLEESGQTLEDPERDSGEVKTLAEYIKESEKEERLKEQLLENSKCKFVNIMMNYRKSKQMSI